MITDEGQRYAAQTMSAAGERAQDAANRIEEAARRMAYIFEDGYGGNALRLIEAIEGLNAQKLKQISEAIDGYLDGAPDCSPASKLANEISRILQ